MHPDDWVIASFVAEKATGTIASASTGRRVDFPLETWWPCEPTIAHELQDSDQRRHLLMPQPGEPVAVEWKRSWQGTEVPGRVARRRALVLPTPLVFIDWLQRLAAVIQPLEGIDSDELRAAVRHLDGDVDDTVFSPTPESPELHLGLLAWLAENGPGTFVATRLGWLTTSPELDTTKLECSGGHSEVFVRLPKATIDALAREQLITLSRC